jgi:hypothetical protein
MWTKPEMQQPETLEEKSLVHDATRDIQLDFTKKRPAVVTGAINEVNMHVV